MLTKDHIRRSPGAVIRSALKGLDKAIYGVGR